MQYPQIREHARKRPGMYIGTTDERGVEQLVYEAASNCVDQFLAGKATFLDVQISEHSITISDDGEGMPYDSPGPDGSPLAEYCLLHHHDAPTATGHSPHAHLTTSQGLGIVIVNVLSSALEVTSWRGQKRWYQTFADGVVSQPLHSQTDLHGRGTVITFQPSREIFSSTQPRLWALRYTLFQAAHLFPGLKIRINHEVFFSQAGLLDLIGFYFADATGLGGPRAQIFSQECTVEGIQIQAVAMGQLTGRQKTTWKSWVNGAETVELGMHVEGFKAALLAAKWKPAVAFIHVIMHRPAYANPVKNKLTVVEVKTIVQSALIKPLKARHHTD
jgi:DNA gyrase/topoisomerase IV subunit B